MILLSIARNFIVKHELSVVFVAVVKHELVKLNAKHLNKVRNDINNFVGVRCVDGVPQHLEGALALLELAFGVFLSFLLSLLVLLLIVAGTQRLVCAVLNYLGFGLFWKTGILLLWLL